MSNWNRIRNYVYRNKEGALLGAIVGYFVAFAYSKLGGGDLSFILQSQGVFDTMVTTISGPHEIYVKLALFSIVAGAILGMILDEHVGWL